MLVNAHFKNTVLFSSTGIGLNRLLVHVQTSMTLDQSRVGASLWGMLVGDALAVRLIAVPSWLKCVMCQPSLTHSGYVHVEYRWDSNQSIGFTPLQR